MRQSYSRLSLQWVLVQVFRKGGTHETINRPKLFSGKQQLFLRKEVQPHRLVPCDSFHLSTQNSPLPFIPRTSLVCISSSSCFGSISSLLKPSRSPCYLQHVDRHFWLFRCF